MTNELTTTTAQNAIMTSTTPKNVIKTRKGHNGKMLSYVSADYVIRTLNEAFGFNWDFIILDEKLLPNDQDPREVVVKGQLAIHGPSSQLTKSQFGGSICQKANCYACRNDYKKRAACPVCGGTGKGDYISIADDLKGAASDALKKCASMLGIALDLYGTTPEAQPDLQPAQSSPAQAPRPAVNGKPANGKPRTPKVEFANQMVAEFGVPVAEVGEVLKLIGGFDEAKMELLKSWVKFIITLSKKFEAEPSDVADVMSQGFNTFDPSKYNEQYQYVVDHIGRDEIPF